MGSRKLITTTSVPIKALFILFTVWMAFCFTASLVQAQNYEVSFVIKDKETGSNLENASVLIKPGSYGGVSKKDGRFVILLAPDTYAVKVSYVGFKDLNRRILVDRNRIVEVILEPEDHLSEVIIKANKYDENLDAPQMGTLRLKARQLQKLPSALGEVDILKGLTLLAGVNDAGDISNGLSVRGGSLDQNLLLYEYAPVFNPTHLFGLFSVFTSDVVSSVDMYRANIPSRYGGRVASVLDVKVKTPYTDSLRLSGGVGLVATKLSVETPIVKDKLMLLAGGRMGFTDFLLPVFSNRLKNTKARFGDGTIKLLYLPTSKDEVSITGFYSKDFYQLDLISRINNINSESNQYDFGILNGTINWQHSFNSKTSLNTVFVESNYKPKIIFPEVDNDNEIEFNSRINYKSLISELSKKVRTGFDYSVGIQANRYKMSPGNLDPGSASSVIPVDLTREVSYELSGFGSANWNPFDRLLLSIGLRYNHFVFVGPYTAATFDESGFTIIDSKIFKKGENVKSYNAPEPRLGMTLKFSKNTSLKGSYARINQYLQNVYNSTTPVPTSRWKTSDRNIKPQVGDAFGLGVYRNFNNNIEAGLEGYFRETENVLSYKPGADFFLEEFLERDVVQGEGKAYGVELSFRKLTGKFNGWFNYTWSRSLLKSYNERLENRINNNEWYSSDFDRPHVFNGTINFEGNERNTLSFNFTAQTGRPFTVANAFIAIEDIEAPVFLERNNSRLPTFHRLDFSWKIHGSRFTKKRWIGDWTFTVYNLYGRKNPINIYYAQRTNFARNSNVFGNSPLGSFEISILNSPVVSFTYNFTFK